MIDSVKYYFPVWYYLTVKNISNYTRGSFFGVFWSLLFPFFQMFVLLAMFSSIFGFSRVELFYSIAPAWFSWFFFLKTTNAMSASLDASSVKMTSVPNIVFPLSRVFDDITSFFVGFAFIACFSFYINSNFPFIFFINGFFYIVFFVFFVVGIGLALSALQVFLKDISYIWSLVCHTGMFVTPIFIPESFYVNSKFWFILKYNPLFYFFKYFKDPLYSNNFPEYQLLFLVFIVSIVSFTLGVLIFQKTNKRFIHYL